DHTRVASPRASRARMAVQTPAVGSLVCFTCDLQTGGVRRSVARLASPIGYPPPWAEDEAVARTHQRIDDVSGGAGRTRSHTPHQAKPDDRPTRGLHAIGLPAREPLIYSASRSPGAGNTVHFRHLLS